MEELLQGFSELEMQPDDVMTFFPTIHAAEWEAKQKQGRWIAARLTQAPSPPLFPLHEECQPLLVIAVQLLPDNKWEWVHLSPQAKQVIGCALTVNYRELATDPLEQWCYLVITKQEAA